MNGGIINYQGGSIENVKLKRGFAEENYLLVNYQEVHGKLLFMLQDVFQPTF